MSLFLIFGGGLVNGQGVVSLDGLDPGSVFKKPRESSGGGEIDIEIFEECVPKNENGEYCFSLNSYFASLDFPCDLYAGLTIEGLNETKYMPISDSDFTFYEATEFNPDFYAVTLDFACYGSLPSILNQPFINDEDCIKNGTRISLGTLSVTVDIYCKNELGEMIPVDLCENYDDFKQIFVFASENIVNCSLSISGGIDICCEGSVLDQEDHFDVSPRSSNIIDINVCYKYPNLKIQGKHLNGTNYRLYSIDGLFLLSGNIDNHNFNSYSINDIHLESGIYIISLIKNGKKSSYKFTSFK